MADETRWGLPQLQRLGEGRLPARFGISFTAAGAGWLEARLEVQPWQLAPNGYLHAATLIALADTCCGYGCRREMDPELSGFTTLELKANFISTALEGEIRCRAEVVHKGRSTQIWDALVTDGAGRKLALFRCTQMLLGREASNPGSEASASEGSPR